MAPTLIFLPGKFHQQRRLAGKSPWVAKSRTWLSTTHTLFSIQQLQGLYTMLKVSAPAPAERLE